MIDPATIAAACAWFAAGWVCRTALERRQAAIALRAKARAIPPGQRPYSGGTLGLHQWHNARVREAAKNRQALEDDLQTLIKRLGGRVPEPIAFADREPEPLDLDNQGRCFLGRPSPEDPAFWDWSHEANEDCTHWLPINTVCLPTRRATTAELPGWCRD